MKLYLYRGLSGLNGEAHWTVGSKLSISKFLTATVLCKASLLSSSLNEYSAAAAAPSPSPNAAARRALRPPPPPEPRRETSVTAPASRSSLPEEQLEKCPKGLAVITCGCRLLSRRHLVIVLMRHLLTCDVAMLHQIGCIVENIQSRRKQDITASNALCVSKSFCENVYKTFFKYEYAVKMYFAYVRQGAPVPSSALLTEWSVTAPEVVVGQRVCACMDMSEGERERRVAKFAVIP